MMTGWEESQKQGAHGQLQDLGVTRRSWHGSLMHSEASKLSLPEVHQ